MEIKWLSYVPLYIALCEEKSIAKAANRLGFSNAHASRQLKQLEEILKVQLIQRTTRQFNLTYDGLAFYQKVKALYFEAESIDAQFDSQQEMKGRLRVAASASFGAFMLSKPLASFKRQYPEIELEVIFTEKPLELIENGFDIAFYLTERPPAGYIGRRIRALKCKPYTSVNYPKLKEVNHPRELVNHRHILYRNSEFSLDQWVFQHVQNNDRVEVCFENSISVNLVSAMVDALIEGCGIAMLDEFALSQLSKEQKSDIIELLPGWETDSILPLYMLYPKREHLALRTRLFVDHFKQVLAS